MAANPSIILPVVQISPPHAPRHFDYYMEDEVKVLIVGSKRGHVGDLQDPYIPYDQALKRARHNSMYSAVVDWQRHATIASGASSSSVSPPPPSLPAYMPPFRDTHDTNT